MNRMSSRQQGFSLIEVLISAVLIAVVVVALTRLQVSMLADSGNSRNQTHALNLAHEKLEEMRDFGRRDVFDGLAAGTDSVNTPSVQLTRSWTVTSEPGYLVANVSVNWSDSKGEDQQVELTSYINAADPVRSGKVLLASVAGAGSGSPGAGAGSGSESGGSSNGGSSGTDAGDSGSDGSVGDSTGGGDSSSGSAGDGSSGDSEPGITLTSYSQCVAATCAIAKGSSISIGFNLAAGTQIDSVTASNGAAVASTSNSQVVVQAPSGKNKAFTVQITVGSGTATKSVLLSFVTS